MNIQWYPGHMTKTRRMIGENLKYVDVVAEVIDARIPIASRNPDLDELVGGKPRVVILNRADQADPAASKVWGAYFRAQGISVLECDARSGAGVKQFSPVMRAALKEQIARWKEKGQVGRPVRAMVVGIPNVGKSTFINKVAKKKSAKAGDRPGVTRGKQWITVDQGLELLDTPGILWPKFEDETIGLHLAFTGAVRDAIMDVETLACHLIQLLAQRKPEALTARFKLVPEEGMDGWALLEAGARKRRGGLGADGPHSPGRVPGGEDGPDHPGTAGGPGERSGPKWSALTCGKLRTACLPRAAGACAGWTRRGRALWPAGSTPGR